MYTKEQFSKLIDHTLLRSSASADEIMAFCDEAKKHHFAAVVVLPFWVPLAGRQLEGSDVKVCTTIGFPHGMCTRAVKVYEVRNAVTLGAEELDVVMNVGALKSGDVDYVRRELMEVVSSANLSGMTQDAKRTLVKIIIETPYLSKEELVTACQIVRDTGADFIKTSTGTAHNGAVSVADVQAIRDVVGSTIGVKAAGGIRTIEHAMDLLDAGANRLGTSTGVALVQTYDPDELLKASR